MKTCTLIVFGFLFSFTSLKAQYQVNKQPAFDSLKASFQRDSAFIYRHKKIRIYANIDFRNAFVDNNFLSLAGLRLGLTIKDHHTIGIGGYVLNELSIFKSNRVRTYEFEKINYLSLIYEYILHDGKYVDIHFPFEIGYGSYVAKPMSEPDTSLKSPMVPTAFGVKLLLMPNAWIGIKFGGGYRYVWEQNSPVGLDGLYFSIGLRIDLARTYQDIKYYQLHKKYKNNLALL